jgi:hypothetical protein
LKSTSKALIEMAIPYPALVAAPAASLRSVRMANSALIRGGVFAADGNRFVERTSGRKTFGSVEKDCKTMRYLDADQYLNLMHSLDPDGSPVGAIDSRSCCSP